MAIRWPVAVGEGLCLSWEGEGRASAIAAAAADAYFELTGIHAVADAEGIAPRLYRSWGLGSGEDAVLRGPLELEVAISGLGRRCAAMTILWHVPEVRSGGGRSSHWIWCWRDRQGRAVAIPEAATIGILAMDGARALGRRARALGDER